MFEIIFLMQMGRNSLEAWEENYSDHKNNKCWPEFVGKTASGKNPKNYFLHISIIGRKKPINLQIDWGDLAKIQFP